MRPAAAALLALLLGAPPAGAQQAPPGAPAAGQAGGEFCPPKTGRLRLEVEDREPELSTELGVEALHASTGEPRTAGSHHLGLTVSRVEWHGELSLRYRRGRPAPGRGTMVCAVPSEVVLRLVQAEHRIHVAREIPPGTCLFREVEAHERRHAAVNRETLQEAAGAARQAASAWLARAEARGATIEEATETLHRGLRESVEPAFAAMREARDRRHDAIDRPDEYRRLAQVCPSDRRALRRALRRASGG